MLEVAHAGEDHSDVVLVALLDGVRIADRTARLDDGRDSGCCGSLDTVVKREERIRGHDRADCFFTGFPDGDFKRADAVCLTGANADGLVGG